MSKTPVNRVHAEQPVFTAASSQGRPEGTSDQRPMSRRHIADYQTLPEQHRADGILYIGSTSARRMCAVWVANIICY